LCWRRRPPPRGSRRCPRRLGPSFPSPRSGARGPLTLTLSPRGGGGGQEGSGGGGTENWRGLGGLGPSGRPSAVRRRRRGRRGGVGGGGRRGGGARGRRVEGGFSWAPRATVSRDTVAGRFPPSTASRAIGDDERRLDELVRAAEADFLALKFDDATARLDQAA